MAVKNLASTCVSVSHRRKIAIWTAQIRKNGKWQAVPYAVEGDVDWNAIGILIEENGTTILPHDWEYLYGALPTGTYRICKEFLRGTGDLLQRQMFYAEFTLP